MIAPGWRAWTVALIASFLIHGALTVGVRQPTSGVKEKPAGTTVSVSGSLASVLGAMQSVPVEIEETSSEVEPVTAKEAEPERADERSFISPAPATMSQELQPVQPTSPAEVFAREQANIAPSAARSATEAPVVATVKSEPVEVTPRAPPPAAESLESKARELREQKRREVEQTKRREQQRRLEQVRRQKEQQRREQAEQRRKREERRRRTRAKKSVEQRKAAARTRAGSNRRGQAGTARGGSGGRASVSTGAINRYGARVRSRILANRPSTSGAGRTVISFGLSAGGSLRYARITRSSGNARLDRAALAAVRRSSPFPRPPAGANARQLRFSISFSFR